MDRSNKQIDLDESDDSSLNEYEPPKLINGE